MTKLVLGCSTGVKCEIKARSADSRNKKQVNRFAKSRRSYGYVVRPSSSTSDVSFSPVRSLYSVSRVFFSHFCFSFKGTVRALM